MQFNSTISFKYIVLSATLQVAVTDTNSDVTYTFPCNRWLSKDEEDGSICCVLDADSIVQEDETTLDGTRCFSVLKVVLCVMLYADGINGNYPTCSKSTLNSVSEGIPDCSQIAVSLGVGVVQGVFC